MSGKPPDPGVGAFGDLVGVARAGMGQGRCRFELAVGPQHLNPHGLVHGAVLYTLVDFAMGGALTSRLAADERCMTLEIKIHYLAPVRDGRLSAEAWVVERTPRIGVLEARVHAGDRLVALATGSFYIQASSRA